MIVPVDVGDGELYLEVNYVLDEESDPGVRTCRNGDPGVPPSCERSVSLGMNDWDLYEALLLACEENGLEPVASNDVPRIRRQIENYILERA